MNRLLVGRAGSHVTEEIFNQRNMQNSITLFSWFSWYFFGALHVNVYPDKEKGLNFSLNICVDKFP